MKSRILGCVLISCGTFAAFMAPRWPAVATVVIASGIVAACLGVFMVYSAGNRPGTAAMLWLNWFVPFLRKQKKNEPLSSLPFLVQVAQRIFPASWFADRTTGKPGLVRRVLKRIGPTVLSSPVRRAIQAICLILFLVLFFYVCWPYTARPTVADQVKGWSFVEADPDNGDLIFENSQTPWPKNAASAIHVADESASDSSAGYLGEFTGSANRNRVVVRPRTPLQPEQLDRLLTSPGPWAFSEHKPGQWPSHYADDLARKEKISAELFLVIDPLVSLSTAIAARSWVWSLVCAAVILIVCVAVPRGFCGYLCPLGTVIDLFDWAISGRVKRFRVGDEGWWVHIKYYLLAGTLLAAVCGVLVSGYVSAIPVITRGMLFLGEPLQSGTLRGWHLVPSFHAGHFLSIGLFALVLGLGLLRPRFWCKYVCPSGAVFSLGNLFRVTERKVESTCINCNKCVEICPFDAIKPDFTTRVTDCTLCQTCGGVCPTHAIKFVERWNLVELKVAGDPPTNETPIGRRGFLSLAAGSTAAVVGGVGLAAATNAFGNAPDTPNSFLPVRPPGSVPEREFLQMCIRCGECFKACPNNVLQVEGFQQGLTGLWTPLVNADWAGCESSCNACGQVCPTGAIRALPLEEKKVARMGLAIVNQDTCLPFAGREACQLCVDECNAAGYRAIEFTTVHTKVGSDGEPVAGSGLLAPIVLPNKCVGCGLCQTRCYGINVKEKHLLTKSAIIVEAGPGNEDRLMSGSYIELRRAESQQKGAESQKPASDFFIPDLSPIESPP